MAQVKQIGPGRKTSGTIDGITYVTHNGKTYVRSTPTMPVSAYRTPAARKRQAIFTLIQMHLKFHLRTIRQTVTPKGNGTPTNRYYSLNAKALNRALDALAERFVAGDDVSITDVEAAIAAYAAEHPTSIRIASLSGYQDVYLTGEWPATITLNANAGDSTVIIIVAENGSTTTYNSDGTTVTVNGSGNENHPSTGSGQETGGSSTGGNTGGNTGGGTETPVTVAAPTITGTTPFEETTEVTISGPAGASIYYTLDGSTPTHSTGSGQANGQLYTEPITLTDTTTVKAIAIKDGVPSSVATHTFTKGTGEGGGVQGED